MAFNKRHGWIRLGIVLSIVWIIGVSIFAFLNYRSIRDGLFTGPGIAGQQNLLFECTCTPDKENIVWESSCSCQLRYVNFAILLLLPLLVCWVATILIVLAFQWVRDGFRNREEGALSKHFDESLPHSSDEITADASEKPQRDLKQDDITSDEKDVQPDICHTLDATKHENFPGVKTVPKKPRKYGWGWILLLVIFSGWAQRNSFSDYTLILVSYLLPWIFLIVYFAFRRRFLKKWKFPGSQPWKAGLAAGLCTYLLAFIVLPTMYFFDIRALNTKIYGITMKYKDRAAFFEQKNRTYQAWFSAEPLTPIDTKQEIKTIDEVLVYEEARRTFIHEMLNDYKQALRGGKSQEKNVLGRFNRFTYIYL